MAPDTNTLTTARKDVWGFALLAGMLLGAGAMYAWLETNALSPHIAYTQPLASERMLSAQTLHLDAFRPPLVLRQVWQETRQTVIAKAPPAKAASEAQTSFISRMQEPMSPVQTAQASVTHMPAAAAKKMEPSTNATIPVAQSSVPTPAPSPARVAQSSVPTPAPSPARKEDGAFPDAFSTGSLGALTKLRAELEQLKMQVVIEETRSRLNQLRGESTSTLKKSMPSLEFPPIGMPTKVATAPRGPVRVMSIQSVNGKYAATVSTSSGPKIVRVNDSVGDGRIVAITRTGVVINRGQGNETLNIQD